MHDRVVSSLTQTGFAAFDKEGAAQQWGPCDKIEQLCRLTSLRGILANRFMLKDKSKA